MNTNIGAVQDALKTAIEAQTSVPVSIGYPKGGVAENPNIVWISGEPDIAVRSYLSDVESRDEVVELGVWVSRTITTASYGTARDACLETVGEVEAALTADRDLGGLVSFAAVSRVKLEEAVPAEGSRQVAATLTVTIESL